jgi:uncharacterized membrane protein (UPF0127 family)
MRTGTVVFGDNGLLNVPIAEADEERQFGLMNVMAMAPEDGMAFMFAGPSPRRSG